MNSPVEYEQTDARWRNIMYSGTNNPRETIGTDGCGPTCAAMVVATLRDRKVTPKEAAQWSMRNGCVSPNDGTYWSFFGRYFQYWKIPCVQTNDRAAAKAALQNNLMVVTAMRKGHWTSVGHFILAYGLSGDKVKIHDPNSEASYRELGYQSNYFSEAAQYWIIKEDWLVEAKILSIKDLDRKKSIEVVAVNIDGSNYIKLRDVEKLAPVVVGYDGVPTIKANYKES